MGNVCYVAAYCLIFISPSHVSTTLGKHELFMAWGNTESITVVCKRKQQWKIPFPQHFVCGFIYGEDLADIREHKESQ